jgi:rubrerythrin
MPKKKSKKHIVLCKCEWERALIDLLTDMVPDVYACKKCGYPVARGNSCTFCGDTNPSEEED